MKSQNLIVIILYGVLETLKIKSYGKTNNFLVNYYGPPSGYKIPGGDQFKPWSTFPRYSLFKL